MYLYHNWAGCDKLNIYAILFSDLIMEQTLYIY